MTSNGPSGSRTLADKLNYLFRTIRPAGQQKEYTNEEVAQATGVSGSYIGYLRKGERTNPTRQHMLQLAKFFGVPVAYLADDELPDERIRHIEGQLGLVDALASAQVREIAMRAHGLSARSLEALQAMLDRVRQLEDLPPVPPCPDSDGPQP